LAVSIPAGRYRFGPDNGTLVAGHDLVLHVTDWEGTLQVGGDHPSRVEARIDGGSLQVREGTGGMQPLGDDDKASIEQTIDDEVLRRDEITYRSTEVIPDGDGLRVAGELTMLGQTAPIRLDVALVDGAPALLLDRRRALPVQSAERHILTLGRKRKPDRDVDEAEADRSVPNSSHWLHPV
jgi:polyisoprenoid-binding protein YceI